MKKNNQTMKKEIYLQESLGSSKKHPFYSFTEERMMPLMKSQKQQI